MNIGCLFGTFDPPHNGHTAIASWMHAHVPFDAVWLVVTPRNPFKQDRHLSADHHRVAMARLAVAGMEGITVCEEELRLPTPNYTVDTLAHFRQRWTEHRFSLIIGSDNLDQFHRWQDHEGILAHHPVVVYPRPGMRSPHAKNFHKDHPGIRITDAPMMDISSTRIRAAIREGRDAGAWLAPAVFEYALREGLYANSDAR
jgi:nicotinate-nucleotide adenylyltransferase